MPELLLVSTLTVALSMGALLYVLATSLRPARSRSLANLQRGLADVTAPEVEAGASSLQALARRITPPTLVRVLERQHTRAGRPAEWPVGRLLTLKLIWVVAAVSLFALFVVSKQQPVLLLLLAVFAVTVYFVPDLLLLSRGQERVQQVQMQLADTLDQMTIAVEAGLGFDAAMARAAANGKGALAEELTRTLQDMRMGRSRREAYEDLAERNQVADLRQFVRAILQADAFGISIGDVLRTQAGEMRLKRRQRAEEKAQQVPVKVLMPLMLCILPVLFIVVLGPAGIGMYLAFSG